MRCFRFNFKHFKIIPKRNFFLGSFFCVLSLYSLFCILQPQTNLLRNTQKVCLTIDSVKSVGVKDRGSTQYAVVSNRQNYYVVYYYQYPEGISEHKLFLEFLKNSTGDEKPTITATVSTEQTLGDIICNRYRILSFSIDGTEYLSMNTTEKSMMNVYQGAWACFILFSIIFLADILFINIVYGIVEFRRK